MLQAVGMHAASASCPRLLGHTSLVDANTRPQRPLALLGDGDLDRVSRLTLAVTITHNTETPYSSVITRIEWLLRLQQAPTIWRTFKRAVRLQPGPLSNWQYNVALSD
jgi:hypothetical protein